jgi:hypothetical protein
MITSSAGSRWLANIRYSQFRMTTNHDRSGAVRALQLEIAAQIEISPLSTVFSPSCRRARKLPFVLASQPLAALGQQAAEKLKSAAD